MDRFEGRVLVGTGLRIYELKAALANCKQDEDSIHAGHDVTSSFQLVGYPEWWSRSSPQPTTGRGTLPMSNSRGWRGGRGGRSAQGGRQLKARARATEGGRPLEA
ncbi:hypothetical protein M9H77_30217 [Catharanthus roseus]|uniref:Uncharacterized protein n=1 Tax=Catharanthus roseus TaxID=4058 RepID=A0ACB9ZYH2_CATRO|nr:hypothetical protein M9H77_30217 [Catharanthus roseus]